MKNNSRKYQYCKWTSITLMILLLIGEYCLFNSNKLNIPKNYVIIVVAIVLLLFIIVHKVFNKSHYTESQTLLKMLVGSLSAPNWYAISSFFLFLCQLTWCMDIGGKLFVEQCNEQCNEQCLYFGTFIVSIEVLVLIGLLYKPKLEEVIKNENRKVLLSGISISQNGIDKKNIELLLKPLLEHPYSITDTQCYLEEDKFSIDHIIILPSKQLFDMPLSIEREKKSAEDKRFWLYVDAYNNKRTDIEKKRLNLENAISQYVFAKCQKQVTTIILKPVDYNNFKECYDTAYNFIKKYEKDYLKGHQYGANTVVHTSPGTGAVSAAMSSIAIKSDRQLVYTEQGCDRRLLKVDFDVLTLKDLFEEIANENE